MLLVYGTNFVWHPNCRSLKWGQVCLVFCKALYGFILLAFLQPNLLLWKHHIICSRAVHSSHYQPHCISTMSFLKYNQPVLLSYQECFLCLVEFCDFSFLKAIFLASLDSPDCFLLWGGGRKKFLGTAADVNFAKKKSRFLDVVLLLNIVCVILRALTMFYQWRLEARFPLFGRYN